MCLVDQVKCSWQECCTGNPVQSSPCAGKFIKCGNIIDPYTVAMDQYRNRISAVVFYGAGC